MSRPERPAHCAIWLAGVAFAFAFKTVADTDLWWHLAAGRWMLEHGRVVTQDPFSYTFAGAPWLSITWGYELMIAAAERFAGGLFGVVTLHAVLAAGCGALAWLAFVAIEPERSTRGRAAAFALMLLALSVVELRWKQRPEMFSHLLGLGMIAILLRDWRRRRAGEPPGALPLALPALQLLWVNTHGTFVLGLFLIAAHGISLLALRLRASGAAGWQSALRELAGDRISLALGLAALACLANPRGLEGALFPARLLGVLQSPFYQSTIEEGRSPFQEGAFGFESVALLVWLGLLALALLVPAMRARFLEQIVWRYGPGQGIVLVALIWLALGALRNVALLVLFSLPLLADFVAGLAERLAVPAERGSRLEWAPAVLSTLLMLAIVSDAYPSLAGIRRFGSWRTPFTASPELPAVLAARAGGGEVFSDPALANDMLFRLPGFRPYIDSRFAEVYPESHLRRYLQLVTSPQALERETRERGISTIALSHGSADLGRPIRRLAAKGDWRVSYLDEVAVVFARGAAESGARASGDGALLALVAPALARIEAAGRPGASLRFEAEDRVRALLRLAEAARLLGDLASSEQVLSRLLDRAPEHPQALRLSCSLGFDRVVRAGEAAVGSGVLAAMEQACLRAVELASEPHEAWLAIGLARRQAGALPAAIEALDRALALAPDALDARLALASAQQARATPAGLERARELYQQAAALRPGALEPRLGLADVYASQGDTAAAAAELRRARALPAARRAQAKIRRIEQRVEAAARAARDAAADAIEGGAEPPSS